VDSLKLGSLFKIPLARGSDPYMSLFSKCTSRVVVIRLVALVCVRLY